MNFVIQGERGRKPLDPKLIPLVKTCQIMLLSISHPDVIDDRKNVR